MVIEQKRILDQRDKQFDLLNGKLASMKQEEEQRSRAPALTIEQYLRQLADRGSVEKLQQMHTFVYSQISGMVLKQNMEQLN